MIFMKKTVSLIVAVLMAVLLLVPAMGVFASAETAIAVVTAENPTDKESYSAKTLAEYLGKITGKTYSVITEKEDFDGYCFYVGDTSEAKAEDTADKADGSYVIRPVENGCVIVGAGNRGTVYGVYGYLEKYCGYACFTAEMGMTTSATEIVFPEEKTEYNTFFEYTDTDWHSPRDNVYSVANGLNGRPYRDIPSEMGGTVAYISGFCHTLASEFCSRDKYFAEHPEYYALRDGERCSDQLCLTNEDVYNIVLDEVLTLIKEKRDPSAALQIVSLTQSDNRNYCTCENCAALDEANGSQAGTMITFVNRIAKAVAEAGYDNIAIDTFAYQYTRKCPTAVVPEDNVIVRLCTIECCFTHPLSDETCERNVELKQDLENWSEICDRIYVWDYTTNYAYTAGFFPDFLVLQENMQFFYEHGVKGVYEEGAYYVDCVNTEFGELRAYLISRLLRDPYCDFDAEMLAFCKAYYGEGGEYIKVFVEKLCENAQKNHSEIYTMTRSSFDLSKEEAEELDALWTKAKEATTDETALANINRSELSWRYVKSSCSLCEFNGIFARAEENEKLYNDLIASGLTMFHEGDDDGEVSHDYQWAGADAWITNDDNVLYNALYFTSAVLYAVTLILALILFVKAIRRKKWILCTVFPLLAGMLEVTMWSKRSFISWNNPVEYGATVAIMGVILAFVIYMSNFRYSGGVAKRIINTFVALLGVFVAYYAPLTIINVIMYDGGANNLALSVGYVLSSACLVAIMAAAIKKLKKSNTEKAD